MDDLKSYTEFWIGPISNIAQAIYFDIPKPGSIPYSDLNRFNPYSEKSIHLFFP